MSRSGTGAPWNERLYAALLHAYPASFREEYSSEMAAAFIDRYDEERRARGASGVARLWLTVLVDTLMTAVREHLDIAARDIQIGWRSLIDRRSRAFTAATLLTLALGIGAVTVIFSVVHAVLLKPLPYAEPESVVCIWEANHSRGLPEFAVSVPNFVSWQERSRSFSSIAGLRDLTANLSGDGEPERVAALGASSTVWNLLGLPPVAGRGFLPEEDRPGHAPVVMISEGLWRRRYGRDPSIVGGTIQVNGAAHTVVGIAPQDVGFETTIDVWMPLAPDVGEESRGDHRLVVLGRLRPGVSIAAAEAEMQGVASALEREYPKTNRDWGVRVEGIRDWLVTSELRTSLFILLTAVAFLLLVACSNVANLQLARATTRAREFGVRLALGASRSRLVRQLLTESALLTAIGGAIGTLLAWLAISAARSALPASIPRAGTISVDVRVFIVAAGVTAVVALLCGVLPGLFATRTDVQVVLRRAGRSAADQRPSPARHVLVVLQLGLATLLTVGALLLAQSFFRLQQVSLGFPTEHLLTARLDRPDGATATPEQNLAFYDALVDALRALPGVTDAGVASQLPLDGSNTQMTVSSEPSSGEADTRGPEASWRIVSPGFLETLRVPLVRGRLFDRRDKARTIILSDGLARQLWTGGEDPIGRQVWLANGRNYTVIGVVGDVRHLRLGELPTATMYLPTTWTLWPSMTVAVRTAGDPGAMAQTLRETVNRLDPAQPLFAIGTMDAMVAASAAPDRLSAQLLGSFAGLALLLSAVGVAGVVAFTTARRTPELAIRMALGASPWQAVSRLVVSGSRMCIVGLGAGLVAAFLLAPLLSNVLYGVGPRDLTTFAATGALLFVVALVACWLPARRALAIDPVSALRSD